MINILPKEKIIIVSGRTLSKLENAIQELQSLGFEAYAHTCDTSKRDSVIELAEYARSPGEIKNVINAAGVSPAMSKTAEQEKISASTLSELSMSIRNLKNV